MKFYFLILFSTLSTFILSQEAYVSKAWIEHNVMKDGEKGINIYGNFRTKNLNNETINYSANISYKNGLLIPSETKNDMGIKVDLYDFGRKSMRVGTNTYANIPVFISYSTLDKVIPKDVNSVYISFLVDHHSFLESPVYNVEFKRSEIQLSNNSPQNKQPVNDVLEEVEVPNIMVNFCNHRKDVVCTMQVDGFIEYYNASEQRWIYGKYKLYKLPNFYSSNYRVVRIILTNGKEIKASISYLSNNATISIDRYQFKECQ